MKKKSKQIFSTFIKKIDGFESRLMTLELSSMYFPQVIISLVDKSFLKLSENLRKKIDLQVIISSNDKNY